MSRPRPLLAVVGATASGKSALAVEVALAMDGEVVNTDAMQLYRGMDVGTAKLAVAERRGVQHHLLDVLDIAERASVAEFQQQARGVIAAIWDRGRLPVLVGGSGLYLRAVLDRFEIPGTDPAVRSRLEHEAQAYGSQAMHERLGRLDPQAAAVILPTNTRRVVRALEVIEVTGRPFSASLPQREYWHPATVQVAIDVSRPELDRRVEQRVDAMWAAGLVDEVRELAARGLRDAPTAGKALGYAQVLRYLDGAGSEDEAREQTVVATRRFIRRQDQWFRTDPRVRWLQPPVDVASVVAAVEAATAARSVPSSG